MFNPHCVEQLSVSQKPSENFKTLRGCKPMFDSKCLIFFFSCGAAAQSGLWPPHSLGLEITHNDAPQA
jgi:hypothetical protein